GGVKNQIHCFMAHDKASRSSVHPVKSLKISIRQIRARMKKNRHRKPKAGSLWPAKRVFRPVHAGWVSQANHPPGGLQEGGRPPPRGMGPTPSSMRKAPAEKTGSAQPSKKNRRPSRCAPLEKGSRRIHAFIPSPNPA